MCRNDSLRGCCFIEKPGLLSRECSQCKTPVSIHSVIIVASNADHILQIVDGDLGVDFGHDNRGMSQNLFGQINIPVFNPVAHGKGMSQAVESYIIG